MTKDMQDRLDHPFHGSTKAEVWTPQHEIITCSDFSDYEKVPHYTDEEVRREIALAMSKDIALARQEYLKTEMTQVLGLDDIPEEPNEPILTKVKDEEAMEKRAACNPFVNVDKCFG